MRINSGANTTRYLGYSYATSLTLSSSLVKYAGWKYLCARSARAVTDWRKPAVGPPQTFSPSHWLPCLNNCNSETVTGLWLASKPWLHKGLQLICYKNCLQRGLKLASIYLFFAASSHIIRKPSVDSYMGIWLDMNSGSSFDSFWGSEGGLLKQEEKGRDAKMSRPRRLIWANVSGTVLIQLLCVFR